MEDVTSTGEDAPENQEDVRHTGEDGETPPYWLGGGEALMADIDIQKQIDDRKSQVVDRQIFEKAVHAAYHLGVGGIDMRRHSDGSRETQRTYNDPDAGAGLFIEFNRVAYPDHTAYESLEILEGEETVFLQKGGTIEGYIPGDWEAELEKLQQPADRARETMTKVVEQKQQASESERATALRKAWGLSAGDDRVRGTDDPKPRRVGVVERPPRRRRR